MLLFLINSAWGEPHTFLYEDDSVAARQFYDCSIRHNADARLALSKHLFKKAHDGSDIGNLVLNHISDVLYNRGVDVETAPDADIISGIEALITPNSN